MDTVIAGKYRNLSDYLMTICDLMVDGNMKLARELASWVFDSFSDVSGQIGKYKLSEYLRLIAFEDEEWKKTAERAMTASIILRHSFDQHIMNI